MSILKVDGKVVTVDGKLINVQAAPSTPYVVAEYLFDDWSGHYMTKAKLYNHTSFMAGEFYGQSVLSEIDYSDPSNNIAAIERQAFLGANVRSLVIPATVSKLYPYCFQNANAGTLTIPDGITEIPEGAFFNMGSNDDQGPTVNLPDGLVSIGDSAFDSSTISSITLPQTLVTIGSSAFSYCGNLSSISIPSSVTKIGEGAFSGSGITSMTIPASVSAIGTGAFDYCGSLTTMNIQAEIDSIPDIFAGGSPLTSLNIPNTVTTIGEAAFHMNLLAEITIPANVTSIGPQAFSQEESGPLTDVYCYPTTPPTCDVDIFGVKANDMSSFKIHVPAGSVAAYQAADGWKIFASIIVGDLA